MRDARQYEISGCTICWEVRDTCQHEILAVRHLEEKIRHTKIEITSPIAFFACFAYVLSEKRERVGVGTGVRARGLVVRLCIAM